MVQVTGRLFMGIDYRWVVDEVTGRYRWVSYTGRQVVDEVTDGYRWVSYAGRRNRHVVLLEWDWMFWRLGWLLRMLLWIGSQSLCGIVMGLHNLDVDL